MIKILMISNSYPNNINGNSGIFVHEQAKALVQLGCKVEVMNPTPKELFGFFNNHNNIPNQLWFDNINVNYSKYRMFPSKYGFSLSTIFFTRSILENVRKAIINFKPDIIHAHWATPSGYASIQLGKRLNIPVVCTLRGSDINTYPYKGYGSMGMTKKVLQRADRVITVSEALKVESESLIYPKKNIEVIYNGVDVEKFKITNNDLDYNIDKPFDKKVLLFVGRVIKEKGIWELLKSFTTICKQDSNSKLIIVGEGRELKNAIRFCYEKNIEDNVSFLGNVPNEEIQYLYKRCDIFILPSYNEGLPNVVVEAMAASKPVIATNVGGIPEVVNEKTGVLVSPRDIKNLTSEILYLLDNPSLRANYGRNGRSLVEEKFNRKTNVKRIYEIYQELCSNNQYSS
ncbi:glycosyltransferase family 4 protein [Halobacillus litoralis]|uniref:glycosyltransferase family 4 protein n=1 Tax=Halobacillus litoralis TaxID=45668 RepID=UPI001CD74E0E|nr:glycosyltransferase family 4 protein [Halobacillus litoralis]MCA1021062.1 glycosyltransferase family 4 protein [Halobacillus litoralis]